MINKIFFLSPHTVLSLSSELQKGITYPQRGPMDASEFRNYFLSYDLIVGILITQEEAEILIGHPLKLIDDDIELQATKSRLLEGRDWKSAYAFSYYIKPNYPGRSSHLCNAGFVVPPSHRGMGLGGVAGRTFLHYGPLAGYRGSVFNLVYANNEASVRIWERLGFSRIGRIPQAGLLKSKDGKSEEYVDAWIIHGDFATLGKHGKSALPAPAE
jgi:ribosomal protein S18 acetylase RimI-like enzyme